MKILAQLVEIFLSAVFFIILWDYTSRNNTERTSEIRVQEAISSQIATLENNGFRSLGLALRTALFSPDSQINWKRVGNELEKQQTQGTQR